MRIDKLIILLIIINLSLPIYGQGLSLIVPKDIKIDSAEYLGYDLKSLRILRNSIFAQYGHIFKSEDLSQYFSQFDWYEPISKNVNDSLSNIDKLNIQTILNIEKFLNNPEYYNKEYFASIPSLNTNLNKNDLRCTTLQYFEYYFWNLTVPESEYTAHICYDICGKITLNNGFVVLYCTWECPAASSGYSDYYMNLYNFDFTLKRKVKLFTEDGILDIGFIKLRNDTLTTKLEKYKGGYWDDYEEEFYRDSIPYEVNLSRYILDVENTEIKQIK